MTGSASTPVRAARFGGVEALKGHAAMLLFSALVAGSFTFGALVGPHIDAAAFSALRFMVAGVVVGVFGLATGAIRATDTRAPWRWIVLGGALATYFVLMFEGLKMASPVSTAAVMTLMPVMTAGFSWLLLRQVTTRRIALALAVGAVGALWVVFRGDPARLLSFQVGRGEVLYFFGCIAHAIYPPLVRKLARGERAVAASFWVLVAGSAMLLAYAWPALRATEFAALPGIVWVGLAYTAVGAMAVTFVCLNFASVRLPSAKVLAYTYLTPGWVILWELAFGRGLPALWTLVGLGLTALALVLLLKHEG